MGQHSASRENTGRNGTAWHAMEGDGAAWIEWNAREGMGCNAPPPSSSSSSPFFILFPPQARTNIIHPLDSLGSCSCYRVKWPCNGRFRLLGPTQIQRVPFSRHPAIIKSQ